MRSELNQLKRFYINPNKVNLRFNSLVVLFFIQSLKSKYEPLKAMKRGGEKMVFTDYIALVALLSLVAIIIFILPNKKKEDEGKDE